MRIVITLLLSTLIIPGCQVINDQPLTGHFEGYFEYRGKKLTLSLDFGFANGKQAAFISIPDNLQLNKPFTSVEYTAPNIELKMTDGDTPITIRATMHQSMIDGNLEGSIPASIHLTKVDNYIPTVKPYATEEVILNNNGTKFSAKLYLPKTKLPSAAIIMIAGSGNHTKEEYNGGADLFASKGIATLIFDKRNVTSIPGVSLKHVNSDITSMKDLISDVEAALSFLKTQKQVRQTKIGLMGFSLGAVEAPVVAAIHPELAFVVAVSGNVTTDREFIINQGLNKYREKGYDAQTIKKAEALYNALFIYAKKPSNKAMLQQKLDKAYTEKWGQLCFPPDPPGEDELKYLLTWNNFEFDPAIYWNKINIPCLVIYGEKDKFIPIERSIEILHRVFTAKKNLLTLTLYQNADHTIRVFPGKDNFEFPKYAPGYITDLLNWLLKQTE